MIFEALQEELPDLFIVSNPSPRFRFYNINSISSSTDDGWQMENFGVLVYF